MGGTLTIQIINRTHTSILDVFSISGDEKLPGDQFKRKENYDKPEIKPNEQKDYKFKLGAMDSIVNTILVGADVLTPMGLPAIQAIMRSLEAPLELGIQYEDGTIDEVSFSLRPVNVRRDTFEADDTISNLFNLDVGNLIKCLVIAPTLTMMNDLDMDFTFTTDTETARAVDQDCRICLMRLDKDRLDHTWVFTSYAKKKTVVMQFEHTKPNYVKALTHEMQNKSKLRMKRKRFMECVHQLMAALSSVLNDVMLQAIIDSIKDVINESASDELAAAYEEQQNNNLKFTTNHHLLRARQCFEALKILATTDQEKQQLDNIIRGIDWKMEGDDFFREANEAEEEQTKLTETALDSKDRDDYMAAADQADVARHLYEKTFKCYNKAMEHDPHLGYLQAAAIQSITKLADLAQKLRGLAGLCSTPDLVSDMQTHRLPWKGKTLLGIRRETAEIRQHQ